MASEQFSQAVRGSGAQPITTSNVGSIQTDNYDSGDSFADDGTGYPLAINPPEVIQELYLTDAGDVEMDIHTVQGDVFTVRLAATIGEWQGWEIDKVVFRDPRNTTAPIYGAWAGE